jgi:hypothetical protein
MSAKDSYSDFASPQLVVSFSRVSGAREESRIRRPGGPKKTGTAAAAALNEVKGLGAAVVPSLRSGRQEPLLAAATRENDKQETQQDQNRHYDMQDSISRSEDADGWRRAIHYKRRCNTVGECYGRRNF